MNSKIEKKFSLGRKEEQPLKLYFFICRPVKINIKNEAVLAIIGYKLEDAILQAQKDSKGGMFTYTGQNVIVKDLVDKISLEAETLTEKKKVGKEQFKAGLLLALNESQELGMKISKKDKVFLKEVISKL